MQDRIPCKVSVIVAVYNAERYLRQCMESIIHQTLSDIEIICVNDGSTDTSLSILEEYAAGDDRIRIFSKENEGLGGAPARNLGLEKAVGTYISILDSDDFFEWDMLEKAVDRAEAADADIVVFGGCEYDDKNGHTYQVPSILDQKWIPEKEVFSYRDCSDKIYQLTQGMAWNKLFRRSFLEKYHLRFQNIKYTDDAYFTFAHMVLAEKITVLHEDLCYYRVNSGVSQTDGLAQYPDSAYLPYTTLKESLIRWGVYDAVKQSLINCAVSFMRYFYDKINDYEAFCYLHDKLRFEVFGELEIGELGIDSFYDERLYLWVRQVIENSAGQLLFKAARASGSPATTGILRFLFPFDKIPQGCKIALIGAGIMGRHFYAQIMLRSYCDVVVWAEKENPFQLSYIQDLDTLQEASFDYAVIAYVQPKLITEAVSMLKDMGIPQDKVILGGTIS